MGDSSSAEGERIGVVVVAYNSSLELQSCVESLMLEPRAPLVVVVDNSSDPSTALLAEHLSRRYEDRFKYHDPGSNLGFARGCNLGVSLLGELDYVAFVNPDVVLTQPLSGLVKYLRNSEHAIVAGGLQSGSRKFSNARREVTLSREALRAVSGGGVYAWSVENSYVGRGRLTVDQLDGALLLLSSKTFEALHGFDEQFDLYYEDVDLCARAKALGGCGLIIDHWGSHKGGASSSSVSALAYSLLRTSRVRYLRKRYSAVPAGLLSLAIGVLAIAEVLARSITRQAEGMGTRITALGLQVREILKPGSVSLL